MGPIPHTLDTIPGFGPVFSGGIVTEIAGVERFDYDQAKVAKYAGLKWRKHQSADFEAQETRLADRSAIPPLHRELRPRTH